MFASPILLTFQPDRDEIDRMLALVRPRKAGRGSTSLGYRLNQIDFVHRDAELWLPIRLAISEVDLFHCPGHRHPIVETIGTDAPIWLEDGHQPRCPWRWLPIVDVAAVPLWAIREARSGWRSTYGNHIFASPVLTFGRIGGDMLRVTAGDRVADAPAEDLVATWERFGEEVRGWLLAEVPELKEHRTIGKWLTDGPPFSPR